MTVININKEDIPSCKFRAVVSESQVLCDGIMNTESICEQLMHAQRLGNEFKGKTAIVFQTEDGARRVETTIWAVTDKFVQIKSGILIPLNAILSIDF